MPGVLLAVRGLGSLPPGLTVGLEPLLGAIAWRYVPQHQDPAPALRRSCDRGGRPAAALQYVKKISGFQRPAKHNAEAFEQAVQAVASATEVLLGQLEIR